jgi:biopolymer transport protein ExbB/TolQ
MVVISFVSIEDTVFHISNVLRVPVLVAAIIALALVLVESGALGMELWRRRGRRPGSLESAAHGARAAIAAGDPELAAKWLAPVATSPHMWTALRRLVFHVRPGPEASGWMSKVLADFDLRSTRRLERTRMLVRAGPALGLMGTLIPLSPALSGLANGDVKQLSDNLKVAFSVTVLGLLIGAVAFGISLVRDRLYAQDLSDMEAIASELEVGQRALPAMPATAAVPVGQPG